MQAGKASYIEYVYLHKGGMGRGGPTSMAGLPLQATDIAMLSDMAKYMRNDYSSLPAGYNAASFPHANMPSLFWWDWNANSGDTGGLVQNDWLTVSPAPFTLQ